MGPQTYDNIGNEAFPTNNRLLKSVNAEHLGDSNITDNGTKVSINSNTEITGSLIVTGDKRKWFWGKRTSVTDITHANPFVETESVQHIEVVKPARWYDSTIFKLGIGFIGGLLLMK
jgi:hypothetical protein